MGKTKFTALEHINSNDFKDDFYESNNKMFCIACKTVVNHARKSVIDNPLNSALHKNKEHLTEASSSTSSNQENINLSSLNNSDILEISESNLLENEIWTEEEITKFKMLSKNKRYSGKTR
ncbi:38267_t:CDS:2 [Gigaspora margarita]|uniref:38267_t:CDS:1 n=1 Tax=Gigaspora margarita TaxID=4874 RepID=A0ABM8VYR2_GIGMA|nr:38267_t:CDS:2 [Gigaspora margarita]